MTRRWSRVVLALAALMAALVAWHAELLILLVLGGCLTLALVAELALGPRWPRCRNSICGGLAGAFLVMLTIGCLVPAAGLRAAPKGDIADGDVFVVFAMGLGDNSPGLSNQAIAAWVIANNPRRLPAITQEGIYRASKELDESQSPIRLPHDPLVYVDTHEAARQALALIKDKGYRRPILVSHDLQLQRMAWHFEALGLQEAAIIPDLPAFPFDPTSIQHWGTRNCCNWVLLERFYSRPIMGHDRWVWLMICLGTVAGALAVLSEGHFLPRAGQ